MLGVAGSTSGKGHAKEDPLLLTPDDVARAAARLEGVANRTPIFTSRTLDAQLGATVFVKAESFQRGGAFKFRGAYNKISSLSPEELARGVAAFSSGNHAQAVAIAATLVGATATIVMPEDTPSAKLEATRGYGAQIVTYDRYAGDREVIGRELASERGLTLVPPYEDPLIMAGQGTVAAELAGQVGPLDMLVVPVGGGGLIAGCATAASGLDPAPEVWGVEPADGDDTRQSLEAGERVRIPVPRTIADGQMADIPGQMTFEINRRLLTGIVTVTDAEIVDAMVRLFDRMKLVTEPSGASAFAALLAGRMDVRGKRVGVVVSGGNVGASRFCQLLASRTPPSA